MSSPVNRVTKSVSKRVTYPAVSSRRVRIILVGLMAGDWILIQDLGILLSCWLPVEGEMKRRMKVEA